VTPGRRRRRALLLLSLSLACGGLAASEVHQRADTVEQRVGPLVPVLVAKRAIPPDTKLRRADIGVRQVPRAFTPRDGLRDVEPALGSRTAAAIEPGGFLTAGVLAGASQGRIGGPLGRGERAVEVAVAGADGLSQQAAPGGRVDVLVSTEPREGAGRTLLALEAVELLGLRPLGDGAAASVGGGNDSRSAATAAATLRVTVRQAVYLTAAQNFAREVRLLSRPPGDRRRLGRAAVGAGGL
jgi:pilus assembly protein CpaB